MLKQMLETIYNHQLIEEHDKIVVGLSGGPDSLALIHALYHFRESLQIELVAVHINHMFRGVLADADEDFVKNFCKLHQIPMYSYRIDVGEYAKEIGTSFEDAGRRVRYQYFEKVLIKENAQKIAVAQNKNDLIETFFINLFRGSGVDGLASIDYKRDQIYIRPLLDVDRNAIEAYCLENALNPRRDHTNDENDYLRNKIRNDLLPSLKMVYNPSLDQTLYKTIKIMKREKAFWQKHSELLFKESCKGEENKVRISKKAYDLMHEAEKLQLLRYAISKVRGNLTNISSDILEQILLLSKTGTFVDLDFNHRVLLSYDELIIQKEVISGVEIMPVLREKKISRQVYEKVKQNMKTSDIVAVDAATIQGNLILRHRKDGDVFVPMGMSGHKKIKDFFIDEKVPKEKRNHIWLVCDDEKIVWVHGMRMNNMCKVTNKTENILLISFNDIVEALELC
ncbi:tRNA lysidine(34) synthetase TilS [Fusibacter ferrireducens]|uniref:tRNA lysidine(34) synthetase TilS n=1 Tax=Fusibacter ferrireducens TaxID=2785058 RepID=UPI001A9B8D6B|nr:tRNA lysidine(34) synthetase TilS [Fusibacter ferrireducens]